MIGWRSEKGPRQGVSPSSGPEWQGHGPRSLARARGGGPRQGPAEGGPRQGEDGDLFG